MRQILAPTLLLAAVLAPFSAGAAGADDGAQSSKEVVKIAEEQALLHQQLQRLGRTMETLLDNLEAEGRPRASELLREGLELLGERLEEHDSLTLDEIMSQSRTRLESGQMVRSIEDQESVIAGLERLVAILMDRRPLENLEESLEAVQAIQRDLGDLADQERDLREATEALREQAANDAQRGLEAGLEAAIQQQRELLTGTEAAGRESGTLELELLADELRELLRDQHTDAEVLAAWRPAEARPLEEASSALAGARAAEARSDRLTESGAELRAAAAELRRRDPQQPSGEEQGARESSETAAALDKSAERAERHARAAGDAAAEKVGEALRAGAEAARRAGRDADSREEAAAELERLAEELERAAGDERAAAAAAREKAAAPLEELDDPETAAGATARDVREALARAEQAAAGGRSASEATREAAEALERGIEDLAQLGGRLSESQSLQSELTQRLERGLGTLPQGDSESGQRAREALEHAAGSMQRAAGEARERQAGEAAESARDAETALEQALAALEESREAAAAEASEAARALSDAQRELGETLEQLEELTPEASLSPEAREAVREAVQQAAQSMQEAASQLEEGSSASASSSQREAISELQAAAEAAREGVRPESPEDRARAEELAALQEQVRRELLALAERNREREGSRPLPALDRADQAARSAGEKLSGGELDAAEEQEAEVEREIENAIEELAEEERQYQELRQEELLFQIVEEVQGLIERHTEQMVATREIDAARAPGERPSRGARLRLRRIAREEAALGERSGELRAALEAEGSLVFSVVLGQIGEDLARVARDLDEEGDWSTGSHVQSLQEDALQSMQMLHAALEQEQQRRAQEGGDQQQQPEGQNRQVLVPDVAELKLLRDVELEVQDDIEKLVLLYPELSEIEEPDALLLEDIERLAVRHQRVSELFRSFREKLGVPGPDTSEPQSGTKPEEGDE